MTRLWKRGAAALGALAAAGAMVATAAPAANAATAAKPQQATAAATSARSAQTAQAKKGSHCPKHKLCIYQYRNYRGKMSIIRHSHRSLGFWNNRISSVKNRTSYPICVYNRWHYYGRFPGYPHTQFYLGAHKGGNLAKAIDNRISSYRYAPNHKKKRC